MSMTECSAIVAEQQSQKGWFHAQLAASQFLSGKEVMGVRVVGKGRREDGPHQTHVAWPSSAAGSSTVPVRVDLVQKTATGGETPPKLAGEDAYATSGE